MQIQLEKKNYKPGEFIRGEVLLDYPLEGTLHIGVVWHTEGRGDEDVEVVVEKEIESSGGETRYAFEFKLPASPYSLNGKLISILWNLEAHIGKQNAAEGFVMSPTGEIVDISAESFSSSPFGSS